jgi:hypothetical protein
MRPTPRYVPHKQLDMSRWDAALRQCHNRLIYAESIYLNTMAGQWDALIGGDYEILMPLPWKKKWGICYAPVIPFVQQSGVFSKTPVGTAEIRQWLHTASTHIRYGDWSLNHGCALPDAQTHRNYILHLQPVYNEIAAHYRKDLRNNLKQAAKHDLEFRDATRFEDIIDLFANTYARQLPHFHTGHYEAFKKLCGHYASQNRLLAREVLLHGMVLAGAILLKDDRRIYNLLSVNLPEGRRCSANHFLYDALIKELAGQDSWFDFEGSDVPGIASFYENFGSINQPYYSLHINRLPKLLRLLKK